MEFPPTPAGVDSVAILEVANEGGGSLELTELDVVEGSDLFAVEGPALPVVLRAGQRLELTLRYRPTSATEALRVLGQLDIRTSVGVEEVELRSTPWVFPLEASPEFVDLGRMRPGGASPIGVVEVENVTGRAVELRSIRLEGAGSFLWAAGAPAPGDGLDLPLTLSPGERLALEVVCDSGASGVQVGELVVETTSPAVELVVPLACEVERTCMELRAQGEDLLQRPLDFGEVLIGSTVSREITVRNCEQPGQGEAFRLTEVRVDGGEGVFARGTMVLPLQLGPGQQTTFTVSFTPQSEQTVEAWLRLSTNAPDRPLLEVEVFGDGMEPATGDSVQVRCGAWVGGVVATRTSAPEIAPWQGVNCVADAEMGGLPFPFPLPGDATVWTVTNPGTGEIRTTTAEEVDFYLYHPGLWEVCAEVMTLVGELEGCTTVDASDDADLVIQLTWDHAEFDTWTDPVDPGQSPSFGPGNCGGDLDLGVAVDQSRSLMRPGMGVYFGSRSHTFPEGSQGALLQDIRGGAGTEVVRFATMEEGERLIIGAHYWSDQGWGTYFGGELEVEATVSIYVRGELTHTFVATLPQRGAFWAVARLHWRGARAPEVTRVNDVADDQCLSEYTSESALCRPTSVGLEPTGGCFDP
ncbi:MAG: choice-of-anchor D domain-containing protein [Deltaproteobacteria bacterium]|nr:MAG: choice-of-anchor D domain-containing protein [Deltaproteobacteria bacterium]